LTKKSISLELTEEFKNVLRLAQEGQSLFVTGKAGTGKSTLLRQIQNALSHKNLVVAAPTGVAALNVDGLTIHRLFAFRKDLNSDLDNYSPPNTLKDLEVLLIDEVSMVRADVLDWISKALMKAKKNRLAFGGTQIIFFGDLYQLPPVIDDREEDIYFSGYSSTYFFAAKSFRDSQIRTIELSRVFRQRQTDFVSLLNSLRDGTAGHPELELINSICYKGELSEVGESTITLCNTNADAERINSSRLQSLQNEIFQIKGTTSGQVRKEDKKTEDVLSISVGARVMMLINEAPYVNGSLATVVDIYEKSGDFIVDVKLDEFEDVVSVNPHTWEVLEPIRVGKKIEKKVIGTFRQIPMRLAWAITVHKSQGLTFQEVIYDKGRGTFSDGQLYVALSRCTTIEGLTLTKKLTLKDIKVDKAIADFFESLSVEAQDVKKMDYLLVSFVSTGGMKFDKCVEIACKLPEDSKITFSTLINPERDLTKAVNTGIDATQLSLAPRYNQVESILRLLFHNKVLISQNFSRLRVVVPLANENFVWGLGHSLVDRSDEDMSKGRAFDVLNFNIRNLSKSKELVGAFKHAQNLSPFVENGSYLLSETDFEEEHLLHALGINSLDEESRARLIAASLFQQKVVPNKKIKSLCEKYNLQQGLVQVSAEAVLANLKKNAEANGAISPEEKRRIEKYASQFGLEPYVEIGGESKVELLPGMKVCLTGAPPAEDKYILFTKSELRKVLERHGFEELASFNKKCQLVVAFNKESLSGKAKKAREIGIPVISSKEFLELLGEI
jgi:energy-coupling factor transporter ATP-binding protein EcfA2